MTFRAPPVAPGFEHPETFADIVRFGDFIRRSIPMLGMLFVVVALTIALLLSVARVATVILRPVALSVAAGVCGGLLVFKERQFEAVRGHARLELGPHGAVLREPQLIIELPWSQVREMRRRPVDRAPSRREPSADRGHW
ncbi:MAG TPA: hypothetical protein VI076_10125 [Actinopolymorphaceae bacterium]